jgi:hypothetical protein
MNPIITSIMPAKRTKNANPKAKKLELSNTTTPRESKIRSIPELELQIRMSLGLVSLDKT